MGHSMNPPFWPFGPFLLCSCVKPVISVVITLFYGGIDPLGCLLGFARVPGSYV